MIINYINILKNNNICNFQLNNFICINNMSTKNRKSQLLENYINDLKSKKYTNNILNNQNRNINKLEDLYIKVGVDEVARGCLIGPVVSSSIIINDNYLLELNDTEINQLPDIKDSKKLSSIKRKQAESWIKEFGSLSYGIGEASTQEILEQNIRNATFLSMNRSILNCLNKYELKMNNNNIKNNNIINNNIKNNNIINNNINLLIDGNSFQIMDMYKDDFKKNNLKINTIIKGDNKELSIACASIIAKEYRDNLINNLVIKNHSLKKYNWDKNKGYGTKDHFENILKYGITVYHRISFLKKMLHREKIE